MLLFGGLGIAVSVNALWMQSDRHPAPLFRQASLPSQHAIAAVPRRMPEPQAADSTPVPASAAASAPVADDPAAAVLPPSRPAGIGRAFEPGTATPTPAKPLAARHSERDPIADLLGGTAPVPPAPIKSAFGKPQVLDKAAHAPAPANDAIAGLIEQTARGR